MMLKGSEMQSEKSTEEQVITSLKLIVGRQSENFHELTAQMRFVCSVMGICAGALYEYKNDYLRLSVDSEGNQIRDEMVAVIDKQLSTLLDKFGQENNPHSGRSQ